MENNEEETTQSRKSEFRQRKSVKSHSRSHHTLLPPRKSNELRKSDLSNKDDFEAAAQIRKSIARLTKSDLDNSGMGGSSDYFDAADYSLLWGSNANTIHTSSNDDHSKKGKLQDVDGEGENGSLLHPRSSMIPFSDSQSESGSSTGSVTTGSKTGTGTGSGSKSAETDKQTLQKSSEHALSHSHSHHHQLQAGQGGKKSGVVTFQRHNLKARQSDVLFLKKRILFPGIWEEDSDEGPDKATQINRRRRGHIDEYVCIV